MLTALEMQLYDSIHLADASRSADELRRLSDMRKRRASAAQLAIHLDLLSRLQIDRFMLRHNHAVERWAVKFWSSALDPAEAELDMGYTQSDRQLGPEQSALIFGKSSCTHSYLPFPGTKEIALANDNDDFWSSHWKESQEHSNANRKIPQERHLIARR